MARSMFSMVTYRIKKVITWVIATVALALLGFGAYYLIVEVL